MMATAQPVDCPNCAGTGEFWTRDDDGNRIVADCDICDKTGRVVILPAHHAASAPPDRGAGQGVATFTLTDEQVVILNDCLFEACNSEQASSDEITTYIALREVLAAQAYPQRPSARDADASARPVGETEGTDGR